MNEHKAGMYCMYVCRACFVSALFYCNAAMDVFCIFIAILQMNYTIRYKQQSFLLSSYGDMNRLALNINHGKLMIKGCRDITLNKY